MWPLNQPHWAARAVSLWVCHPGIPTHSVPTSLEPVWLAPKEHQLRIRTKKNILVSHVADHRLSVAGLKPGSCLEVGAGNLEGEKSCFEVETSLQ